MNRVLVVRSFLILMLVSIFVSGLPAQSPLRKYITLAETDKFNPGPAGKTLVPKPGGKIVIRITTDPRILNPFVSTGATAAEIMTYLYSTLISSDPETLEIQPTLSWKIETRDLIILKNGTKLEGLIQSQSDSKVTILENAGRVIVGKQDFDKIKVPKNNVKELDWTYIFETAPKTAVREIKISEIAIWPDKLGEKVTKRPSVKERVVFYYHLRDKINWQDGAPITVDNFRLSYDTIMNIKVDSPHYLAQFQDVESFETP